MTESTIPSRPLWLRILQFPLTRLIVLGVGLFYLMGWTEGRIEQFKENPESGLSSRWGWAWWLWQSISPGASGSSDAR